MNPYSLMVAVGAGLGLAQVYQAAPRKLAARWLNLALLVLLCALLGARLVFVVLHPAYFAAHPLEIPQVWLGGLDWPGALLGGLLAWLGIALYGHSSPGKLADALAQLAPPLAVFAWLGGWQVGSAYGQRLAEGTWWGIRVVDETGLVATRWPLQPAAAAGLVVGFVLLQVLLKKDAPPGLRASLVGLVLALDLLPASLGMAEPAPLLGGLRPDTWAAIVLALTSLAAALVIVWRKKRFDSRG